MAQVNAFIVLGYVLSPFIAWLVYWIVKRVRHGKGGEEAGETES